MHAVRVVVPGAYLPILGDFALDREVGLLRVTKLEILLHRNRKRHDRQRIAGAEGGPDGWSEWKSQVALTGEERIGLEEIESLLVSQIAHRCWNCGRAAGDIPWQRTLKNVRGIESRKIECVVEVAAVSRKHTRGAAASFNQRRLRAVECIGKEPQCEGRVVIKDSVTGANHRLTIAPGIPSKADAGLHVLGVERDPLKDALGLRCRCTECCGWRENGRPFDVVPPPVLERQLLANFPAVLGKNSQRLIRRRAV